MGGLNKNGGGGSGLPDQSGHAGEVLSTDGSALEWVPQGGAATLQIEASTLAGLKAIATTSKLAGHVVLAKFSGEGAAIMVLTAGTSNDDNAGQHRPDDYNGATNIKFWQRAS